MRDRARLHSCVGANNHRIGDRRYLGSVVLFAIVALTLPEHVATDTLYVVWERSVDSTVEGYVVHVGLQPGVYTQTFDVGNTDTFRMSTIQPGQQYCVAVTSYRGNLASQLSNEACGYSNMYPSLAAPGDQYTIVKTATSLQLSGSDPGGDKVTYSAIGLPAGLLVHPDSGLISGTPTASGLYAVTVTVSDGVLSASRTFTWVIAAVPSIRSLHEPTASARYTGTVARPRSVSAATSSTATPSAATRSVARDTPARESAALRVDLAGTHTSRAAATARPETACGPDAACKFQNSPLTSARDGVHPAAAPDVRVEILTPVDQAVLSPSVLLWGRLESTETGGTRSSIVWTSSLDGWLGTGERVVTSLRRGTHILTASVVPEHGPAARTVITVHVAK